MSDKATEGTAAKPALRTLADKMNWLIEGARPAGRGPYTNAEVSSAHTTDRRGCCCRDSACAGCNAAW